MIDIIYCISLKEYELRRNFMISQLENINITHKIIDAHYYTDDYVINEMNQIKSSNSNLKDSQIAISMSHHKCALELLQSDYKIAGILEDDIKIVDDFKNKLDLYFLNSTELINKIDNEPIIIFLTGLTSINPKKQYKYKNRQNTFSNIGAQYGNCFYIINRLMAKILVDNFYPITKTYDDYIIGLKNTFSNYYSALPILCYDLSSNYYKQFWTKDDIIVKKNFNRLSRMNNKNIDTKKINIINTSSINFTNYFFKRRFDVLFNVNYTNILFGDYINNSNNNTFIFGSGISSNDDIDIHSKKVFFVRGKLTYDYLTNKNINIQNKTLGDPFLLMSNFIDIEKQIKYNYCFILKEKPDTNLDGNIYINSNEFTNIEHLQYIVQSNIIFTDILLPIVFSHSYDKKVFWVNSNNIDIVDYYTSYNIQDSFIRSFNLYELLNKYNLSNFITFIDIGKQIIDVKKSELLKLMFILHK